MSTLGAGSEPSRRHRNAAILGIVLVVACAFFLTANDTVAKLLTETMPVGQIVALRALLVILLLAAWFTWRRQWSVIRISNRRAMLVRALAMTGSTFFFINALRLMPIADAIAIAFAAPLFSTILSIPILGERVGWRRWAAVLLGLIGVLIAMQPSGAGYSWVVALLPLGAACCGAIRDITSRRLTATDASVGVLFYTALTIGCIGGLTAFAGDWVMPDQREWALIGVAAVLIGLGHFLQVESFRYAEVSFLAPVRYVSLIFATVAGFLIWGHVPAWNVILGASVIVASGLVIWYRQARTG